MWPPDRLLVSPGGVAHLPTCGIVPARRPRWGEIVDVDDAIEELMIGNAAPSRLIGHSDPGPLATRLCRRCLGARTSA